MIERWSLTVRAACAGAILGALLLILAIIGGRGNTALLRLLFPVGLYFGDWMHSEFCFAMAALVQWPLYGAVLGWAMDKRSILAWSAVVTVAIAHVAVTWSLA